MTPRAATVIPCTELAPTVEFFASVGFVTESVMPADDPTVIEVSGHGTRLRLERSATDTAAIAAAPALVLAVADPDSVFGPSRTATAPNGSVVSVVPSEPAIANPPLVPESVVVRHDPGTYGAGRAGMHYRDLIPNRQGGRFIASHIRIDEGGPVPDSVHYHRIRFQMLYCLRGWVKVVYEDQGEPFVMQAGDAVLQPPEIRHRVLESSDAFEIIEIGDPAEHQTLMDHELELPTPTWSPGRDFGGQRFHHHVASQVGWIDSMPGWQTRDLEIAEASNGVGSAVVHRVSDMGQYRAPTTHDHELHFTFVLDGEATVTIDGQDHEVSTHSAITVPAQTSYGWTDTSADLALLEVSI